MFARYMWLTFLKCQQIQKSKKIKIKKRRKRALIIVDSLQKSIGRDCKTRPHLSGDRRDFHTSPRFNFTSYNCTVWRALRVGGLLWVFLTTAPSVDSHKKLRRRSRRSYCAFRQVQIKRLAVTCRYLAPLVSEMRRDILDPTLRRVYVVSARAVVGALLPISIWTRAHYLGCWRHFDANGDG